MKTVIVAAFAFLAGATVAARAQGVGYPYGLSPHVAQELAAEEAEDLRQRPKGGGQAQKAQHPVDPWADLTLLERQVKALERIARALEGKCACAPKKEPLPELLPSPQTWLKP